jgi:hypothetical protein
MSSLRFGVLAVTLTLALACDDATGDSVLEVEEFAVTECKAGRSASRELFTGRDAAAYVGLQCIAWSKRGSDLVLDLINFPEGCGFGGNEARTLWKGSVSQESDAGLVLGVTWDFQDPSACGECLHDFSFDLSHAPEQAALPVAVETRSCTACDARKVSASLPVQERPQGILCQHFVDGPLNELAPGGLHALAREGECDSDLVAHGVDGAEEPLCLAACGKGLECPLPEVLTCSAGACVLAQSW